MVTFVSTFPPPSHVPLAASPTPPERGFTRWPLWVKIATPIGGLLLVGGIVNALRPDNDSGSVQPLAAVETTVVETTTSTLDTTILKTTTTATIAATTVEPTSTPPPTAAPLTTPPTPAPTPAPTTPPTSPPPPAPAAALTDPRFGTCKEAKAHGYGPYRRGVDPEYDWYRDADGDGIACE